MNLARTSITQPIERKQLDSSAVRRRAGTSKRGSRRSPHLCLEQLGVRLLLSASQPVSASQTSPASAWVDSQPISLSVIGGASIDPDASPLGSGSIGPVGLIPSQIKQYYDFNNTDDQGGVVGTGAGQTIAIVDAYVDPNIAPDLETFDTKFGLPAATLSIAEPDGDPGAPQNDANGNPWGLEIALDIEWAHALAPEATILYVAVPPGDLLDGVDYARSQPGVSVVSMSWDTGVPLTGHAPTATDSIFATPSGHQGVTFVAASGDQGNAAYPAQSSNVLAVGGTVLTPNLQAAGGYTETAWSGSGGGVDPAEPESAAQQQAVGSLGGRAVPDVSFDAGTAVAVYDSYDYGSGTGWIPLIGTSFSAPAWAAIIAIADQGRAEEGLGSLDGATQTLPLLYHMPSSSFHNIPGSTSYNGGPDYDLKTGLGSPVVNQVVDWLARPFTLANGGSTIYQRDPGNNLYAYSSSSGWGLISGNVQSFAVGSDGSLYWLRLDGALFDGYNEISGNVQSFAVGGGGSLYWLRLDGALFDGYNEVSGNVQSFAVGSDGSLYWLRLDGALFDGYNEVSGNVQSFAVGGGGSLYWLRLDGALFDDYTEVSGNVRSFAVGGDGSLYWLRLDGDLFDGYTLISGNVRSFGVGGGGSVYWLLLDGDLYTNGYNLISSNVQSFAVGGDGAVYWLGLDGDLFDAYGLMNANVQSYAVGGDGGIYVLDKSGDLNRYSDDPGGGTRYTIDDAGEVTSIAVGGDGGVYVLKTNGNLDRYYYDPAIDPWTSVDDAGEVTSIAVGGDGGVYVLKTNGNLDRYYYDPAIDPWTSADDAGEVTSIAVGGDGGVYVLKTNGNLDRYYYDPAIDPWTSVDDAGEVTSIAVGDDGGVYVLKTNGNLDRYYYDPAIDPWTSVDDAGYVRSIATSGSRGGISILLADDSLQLFDYDVALTLDSAPLDAPAGIVTTDTPALQWSAVSGAAGYDVYVVDTTTGNTIVSGAQVTGTSYNLTVLLNSGHSFKWWVTAFDGSGDVSSTPQSLDFAVSLPISTLPAPIRTPTPTPTPAPTPTPTPAPTPTPIYIISEVPLFNRKTNKKGKPVGSPVLTGFKFDFSAPLNLSSATSRANFEVDTITTKRVQKKTQHILNPITGLSVAYSAVSDSVTLTFAGKQTFPSGGRITVVGGPSGGVIGESGATLAGNTVFTISSGGTNISAQ
jgi:hypothetical protein